MNRKREENVDLQRLNLRRKLGIESQLRQREVITIGDLPLHTEYYHHDTEAPLLLFLPGIGTYSELYAELLHGLCEQGFNVVGVDLRGHGYSGGQRGLYTVEQVVADCMQVIDHYRQIAEGPVYLYGYSIGALLAVAAAEQDPRIEAVVCGTLLVPGVAPDMLHQLGWSWIWGSALLMPGVSLPMKSFIDYDRLLAGHPAGEEINSDPRIVFDYPLKTLSSLFTHRLGVMHERFRFRGLIIHGERDEVLPLSYSERVVEVLTHPFELQPVEGEGHMLPWDDPARLIRMICHWLQPEAVTKA
ncbi:alpha/beta hydrolase [Marinobacterium sediminicola]|uniref:Pimeloyl-ACP methyl ester carboxylesterase n=1 Tax=Marinobacterium sediminicola TaxID=518898 RepID=A0ABY1RZ91_9GAMM|nr:alpha/beta hydrolase [Marinobacterium sediminicola]ULG69173.1 alpha/beta hydrolase [Marinobacterium sediminicola]SMR73545.1 Pimeloyl-ACP methyl ester carboxylesterase [Marinobacterium sediminicola]